MSCGTRNSATEFELHDGYLLPNKPSHSRGKTTTASFSNRGCGFSSVGVARYQVMSFHVATYVRTTSIFTNSRKLKPPHCNQMIRDFDFLTLRIAYTTIKTGLQQVENLLTVLKTRPKKLLLENIDLSLGMVDHGGLSGSMFCFVARTNNPQVCRH